MLIVECVTGLSRTHGVGLFAKYKITQGTVIWVRHSKFDILVDESMVADLPAVTREYLGMIMYLRQDGSKRSVICTDHARHINHSDTPNCKGVACKDLTPEQRTCLTPAQWAVVDESEDCTVAMHDIEAGEEISVNYLTDFPDPEDPHMSFLYNKD